MSVRGPRLWNGLPETVKNSPNINLFQKNLKKQFIQNQN